MEKNRFYSNGMRCLPINFNEDMFSLLITSLKSIEGILLKGIINT
jgi:hypothetical protein